MKLDIGYVRTRFSKCLKLGELRGSINTVMATTIYNTATTVTTNTAAASGYIELQTQCIYMNQD